MNRRGFILGAGALAAPSIIGISGVIQLSRPALVVERPLLPDLLGLARDAWMGGNSMGHAIGSAWADAVLFGRGALVFDPDGTLRRVDPFGPEAEKATILELASSPALYLRPQG